MKFSLVLCTISREVEVKRLLESLLLQVYKDFELVIVDQNSDDRVVKILEQYKDRISINYIHSSVPGASRARNTGLRHATGDIIAFPDDDCWYPGDLLERVCNFFKKNPHWDGLTGCAIDADGKMSTNNWDEASGSITYFNIWNRSVAFTIFLRDKVTQRNIDFDEDIGGGAVTKWEAGEESDYLIRILKEGFSIFYNTDIKVYHPSPLYDFGKKAFERGYRYGLGTGYVFRKNKLPFFFSYYRIVVRPFGGIILSCCTFRFDKAQYYWHVLKGRVIGWVGL